MKERLNRYRQNGVTKIIPCNRIEVVDQKLPDKEIHSNVRHILALTKASDALVLASEDGDLQKISSTSSCCRA